MAQRIIRGDIIVSNLHWITGTHQLKKHFSKFGQVKAVYMKASDFTPSSARVVFADSRDADKMGQQIRHKVDNKIVKIYRPR